MSHAGSLEFALVRMQSRLADRLTPARWRSLEHVRALGPFVAQARNSGWSEALQGLGAVPAVHEIEAALRDHWRRSVEQLARWMPGEWSAAVLWCALLPDLPALGHLLEQREPPAWMDADAILREIAAPAGAAGAARLRGPLSAAAHARDLRGAWSAEWRRRLAAPGALEALGRLVAAHAERFATAAPHDADPLRRALEARLLALFRAQALEPVAAFAWLGLLALDLERLRGELVTRALLPEGLAP